MTVRHFSIHLFFSKVSDPAQTIRNVFINSNNATQSKENNGGEKKSTQN